MTARESIAAESFGHAPVPRYAVWAGVAEMGCARCSLINALDIPWPCTTAVILGLPDVIEGSD